MKKRMVAADYSGNIGKRVTIQSVSRAHYNGRAGEIVGVEAHGVDKNIFYYRVERIDGLDPGTSLLYKVYDVKF